MATIEATPTQAAHPWRATLRTAVAVGIPAFAGLVLLLPLVLSELASGPLSEYLPPGFIAWLVAAAGFITAASAAITRIMAIPGVVEWFRKYLRALSPDGNPPGRHEAKPIEDTTADAATRQQAASLDRVDGPDHRL
ncbi:hypothetical protein FJV46_10765 [Arthrobacter agilis]|uniref:hypothetical protein n=1 Tax=Arthrobacter agilis TaxID=37921 RepID=UPI000B34D7B6|nr:hypothetical protein [Arthrobacter agilis]OUM44142.1 hypothetical protein B8W74_04520 [Arthrobacter agilis]PPB46518.1 hypothetical protein CI784_06815 [Arthrobacter agilis]TPV23826.1 hypothetical protein FJV46_10765 [Arthrobacter agilis]VDR32561.1 Uncharacterised protein [Arthrobacter agilis]